MRINFILLTLLLTTLLATPLKAQNNDDVKKVAILETVEFASLGHIEASAANQLVGRSLEVVQSLYCGFATSDGLILSAEVIILFSIVLQG